MTLWIKNVLFTLVVPGTVAVWVPGMIVTSSATGPFLEVVAGFFFGLGGIIYFWCLWDFAAWGRGTPAPIDAPKKLVARGLYRWTRNPMYCGVLSVLWGWFILDPSLRMGLYFGGVGFFFHLFVVFFEEPSLARRWGQSYAHYRAAVPRWLFRL